MENAPHSSSKATRPVVVVGAGAIGAATAHYLVERGHQVLMLEQHRFGGGCSHGNCGYISPSHVLPLCVPGAPRKTVPRMLSRSSPVYVRPRWDPALWGWMFRFAQRCNPRDMMAAARARHALLQSSMSLFESLVADGLECEWEKGGCLFVYRTESEFESYGRTAGLVEREFGISAQRLDGNELRAREPTLRADLAGAWHYDCDAQVRPEVLLESWRRLLEERGVKIREGVIVQDLSPAEDGVRMETSEGVVEADRVAVATGAWTPLLSRALGTSVPIQAGKGYSITSTPVDDGARGSMIFQEHKVAITPMRTAFRIGSTMEFAGLDESIDPARLSMLTRSLPLYFEHVPSLRIEETWAGWRPMTFDGLPFIDFAPRTRRVVVAAGHNMEGMSMCTATGLLAAEMLSGETPHLDVSAFGFGR